MTAVQGHRGFTAGISHFRNDKASGAFLEDQMIADPVLLIQLFNFGSVQFSRPTGVVLDTAS